MKLRSFVRKMVKKLKQINLNIVVELRISLHHDLFDNVDIAILEVRAHRDHEVFELVLLHLNSLLLLSERIVKRTPDWLVVVGR